MQLLWINLVTDSLPAIALGMEPVEADIMNKPPKQKNESIFANGLGVRIILQGIMFAALSLIAFWLGALWQNGPLSIKAGQTMAFVVLSMSQVLQSFNMRSDSSLFKTGVFGNKTLNISALASIIMVLFVLFTPGVNTAFGLIILPYKLYLIALGLIFVPTVLMEFAKLVGFIKNK